MSFTPSRLWLVEKAFDFQRLDAIDREATMIALFDRSLASFDERMLERLVHRRALVIAVCEGHVSGNAVAAALWSDYLAVGTGATFDLGHLTGEVIAAAIRRIGRRAFRLLLNENSENSENSVVSSASMLELGLADSLVTPGEDSVEWLLGWLGRRSLPALLSAASLVRLRGGDTNERGEFARLFSTGEPREGLAGFLSRTPTEFSRNVIVEKI